MAVIKKLEFSDYVIRKRMTSGHGGPRKGAGAKRIGRGQEPHRSRLRFHRLTPAHVTLRVVKGLSSLRNQFLVKEVRKTFAQACERGDFRLVEYSIQHNHIHFIVEAETQGVLSRGMKSIASRFAKAVNRIFRRRGQVIAGRYHVQLLTSPRQVRNALRYVLLNIRKHIKQREGYPPPVKIDAASSGSQFDGWRQTPETLRARAVQEEVGVAKAASWLLSLGWRRHGLIDPSAVPG